MKFGFIFFFASFSPRRRWLALYDQRLNQLLQQLVARSDEVENSRVEILAWLYRPESDFCFHSRRRSRRAHSLDFEAISILERLRWLLPLLTRERCPLQPYGVRCQVALFCNSYCRPAPGHRPLCGPVHTTATRTDLVHGLASALLAAQGRRERRARRAGASAHDRHAVWRAGHRQLPHLLHAEQRVG